MSQPVVHFEVIGKDPQRLREYFGELFGWKFDVPSPVAQEVSDPASYGFLDLVTSDDGTGIRGGVGGGPGYASHAAFYVGVPNVEAALQRAEDLGGARVMGPAPHRTALSSPQRYTALDVAATLSELSGREVVAQELARMQWVPTLERGGLSASYAELVAELFETHNSGRIDAELGIGEIRRSTTELREALAAFVQDDR